jgi:uncharacterized protein YyaL (SSP411 family)
VPTSANVDVARARQRHLPPAFAWEAWGPEAFARAKRENKPILLDGSAAWCHWCHVMDETTYRDPAIGKLLRDGFVPIRFDVDEHPDLAERYGAWGWPATILLAADASEIGKYRGYLPPEELHGILEHLEAAAVPMTRTAFDDAAPHPEALDFVAALAVHAMDGFYDSEQGGWGMRRKAPLSANAELELRRAAHGDRDALKRAAFSLKAQRALIDPVWGGIYQYSAASDWKSPHFEKLMTYQAPALEAAARAYQATRDAAFLDDARSISGYLLKFLRSPRGAFYANQDADLGAHDERGRFVDGRVFYAHDDAGRRSMGLPWVDTHVYARENGLAIAALCALYEASGDLAALTAAREAAEAVLATHVDADGSVRHEAASNSPRMLPDAAALGRGLTRLAQTTGQGRYREAAVHIAQGLERLRDPSTHSFWEHSEDPDAAGVFARREHPFAHNVAAARFLGALTQLTGDPSWAARGRDALAAVSTPSALDEAGPWLGELLLGLDDVGALRWP